MSSSECPICFELIDNINDKMITQCNHEFHSSCFLTNVAHNGFSCPCCRRKLAEIPDSESESEDENEDLDSEDEDDENLDSDDEDEDEDEDDEYDYAGMFQRAEDNQREMLPDVEFVWQKLKEMKYTSLDLLKIIMHNEMILCKNTCHFEYGKLGEKMETDTMKIIDEYEADMYETKEEQSLMILEDSSLKNKLNIEIRQQGNKPTHRNN